MTGSALRRGTFWLNTIVSKGRRVWEEGGEIFSPIGSNWVTEWNAVDFPGGSKSVAGMRYTLETFRGNKGPKCSFFGVPKGFKSMAGAIL